MRIHINLPHLLGTLAIYAGVALLGYQIYASVTSGVWVHIPLAASEDFLGKIPLCGVLMFVGFILVAKRPAARRA